MESWETGGKEVTSQAVSFGVPGDFIKGTYTSKKYIESKDNYLYELKGDVGQYHPLDDTKHPVAEATSVIKGEFYQIWGGKAAIDDLFKKSKFGDIVAVKFEQETPAKTKGNNPFKVFKTMQFGADPDYMGEDSSVVSQADVEGAGL